MEDVLSAFDETGTAKIRVKVIGTIEKGKKILKLVGNKTGTTLKVPVRIKKK